MKVREAPTGLIIGETPSLNGASGVSTHGCQVSSSQNLGFSLTQPVTGLILTVPSATPPSPASLSPRRRSAGSGESVRAYWANYRTEGCRDASDYQHRPYS